MFTPHLIFETPDFDGEAFFDSVAKLLERDYQETDVQAFDLLIDQLGQDGVPCYEVAQEVYLQIVLDHTCDLCGCDSRVGAHGVLHGDSWNDPSYYCTGERRHFRK